MDALQDRFWRNFSRYGLPKSRTVEPLTIELRLSPERARRGGALTFRLPVFYPCPVCKGTGSDWGYGCLHCSATGMREADEVVRISLPPHLQDRDLFQVPVGHHGIQNLALNLLVRVDRR
jgi:DnaJ-class molecular chaperone